jgi:hypothetical protein
VRLQGSGIGHDLAVAGCDSASCAPGLEVSMPEHDVRRSPSNVIAWVILLVTVFVLAWLVLGWMAADTSMTEMWPKRQLAPQSA